MKYVVALLIFGSALLGAMTFRGATPVPLEHTFASSHDLAVALLEAFSRRDAAGLAEMALTGREFRHHVWPELPASRAERNLTVDYVWNDLHAKSRAHLARHLRRGLPAGLALVRITWEETTKYPSFSVHRNSRLHVKDAAGRDYSVRLFGSILEKDGRHKVFSFVTD